MKTKDNISINVYLAWGSLIMLLSVRESTLNRVEYIRFLFKRKNNNFWKVIKLELEIKTEVDVSLIGNHLKTLQSIIQILKELSKNIISKTKLMKVLQDDVQLIVSPIIICVPKCHIKTDCQSKDHPMELPIIYQKNKRLSPIIK